MSLIVWLPLNGSVENQGLAQLTPSGTPVYLNSRFGKGASLSSPIYFTGLPQLSTFSISFWVNVTDCLSNWTDALYFRDFNAEGTQGSGYRYESTLDSYSTRGLSFHDNSGYCITTSWYTVVDAKNEWHHIVATYDGTTLIHYRDGEKIHTGTGTGGYIANFFRVGESSNISGMMNDLRVYDEVLSQKQIKLLSQGLMSHYKFAPLETDSIGTFGYEDVSGFNNNGTKMGTLTYNADSIKYNSCVTFYNGGLQYIPSVFNADTDAFTISCWFRPTSTSTAALYNNRTTVGYGISVFWIGGKIRFDTGGDSGQWTTGGTAPSLNKWNFITLTFDKTNSLKKYYLNGVLQSSTSTINDFSDTIGTYASIGGSSTGGGINWSNMYYGDLNDFRIYGTILSDEDILSLYQTKGTIDNKGNIQTDELIESNSLVAYVNGPANHTNFYCQWTQSEVDDEESPTGKATKLVCTGITSGYEEKNHGYYIAGSHSPWKEARAAMVDGEKYTLSMYVKMNNPRTQFNMNVEAASSQSKNIFYNVSTEYIKLVNTFTYNSSATYYAITNYIKYFEVGDEIYIHSMKIEKYNGDNAEVTDKGILQAGSLDEQEGTIAKMYTGGLVHTNSINEI